MSTFLKIAGLGYKAYKGIQGAKAQKKLVKAQIELGQQRMALATDMANWIKAQSERNWEAYAPQRELGYKAIAGMDAHMAAGDFNPRPVHLPAATTTPLPRFGGEGVTPPRAPMRPATGIPNRWPDQVAVPGGEQLPPAGG